ncbi:Gfo/Idh/MocA family protein [Petrocella sp. FN5]|uniref:Gfo/Idh/MocA family protein n=1 Tax=Petrocella sp. FN5 TaxID=3032002 RepID=UPI0023DA2D7E|nr:Gfo/Idh/MocA family oxidoreductase [Petrocella sp. FN5]MDF1618266.1 Gfo/Idh/MocA family oxidoreductase [Petrocella sp. FN5]
MRKLRIGIVGTGFIGKQHIEAIRRIPGTEIVAIANDDVEVAKDVSEALNIARYYSDYRKMLDEETLDVVHNCTPSAYHYPINRAVIEKGIHIFCEKPLALTTDESENLVELLKQYKVANGVNFNYRHNAMVQEMRGRVKNGSVGKVHTMSGEYLQDWLMYDTDYDWRLDPMIGGKGRAISDIGSHCFDTIQFITGKKIVGVNARLVTVYPIRKVHTKRVEDSGADRDQVKNHVKEVAIQSDDAAHILLELEDGTQGVLNISQVFAGKKNAFSLHACGEKASLTWHQEQADRLLVGNRDKGNEEIFAGASYLTDEGSYYSTLPNGHPVGWADALRSSIHSFYNAIQKGSYRDAKQGYATFETGHYIMRLVDACIKSHEENSWVRI